MSLHLSSLFHVSLWPTLSWRVFSSLFLNLLNLWLSTRTELALILALTAATKTFFNYFMTSTSLQGSGGNQELQPALPCSQCPGSSESSPMSPAGGFPAALLLSGNSFPLFSLHSFPQQSSWSSQSVLPAVMSLQPPCLHLHPLPRGAAGLAMIPCLSPSEQRNLWRCWCLLSALCFLPLRLTPHSGDCPVLPPHEE